MAINGYWPGVFLHINWKCMVKGRENALAPAGELMGWCCQDKSGYRTGDINMSPGPSSIPALYSEKEPERCHHCHDDHKPPERFLGYDPHQPDAQKSAKQYYRQHHQVK